jgi:hypothetical protein
MNWIKNYWMLFITVFTFSCEKEFIPRENSYEKKIVIESYLEKSNNELPYYAIISYSLPFYSTFSVDIINASFVHDAEVSVSDGTNTTSLQEICLNDVQEPLRTMILDSLGLEADSIATDICIYIDLQHQIHPEEGINYTIQVIKDLDTITGKTNIPPLIAIDSIWFDVPPGKDPDTGLAQMFCIISDLPQHKDFYRYMTAGQDERLIANVNSVTDDVFFDGQKFKFTLSKALGADEKFDDDSGLFKRGQNIRIKWCNISETHYNFWNTLETSRTRQGPFSSYVRITNNITNGLGIFGGQHCEYYEVKVPYN